jgi:hypothetical protein
MGGNEAFDHCSLAIADTFHVDMNVTGADTELRATPQPLRHLRRMNDVLARHASDIRTRAADQPALYDRDALPCSGECPRKIFPRFATTQDENVVTLGVRHWQEGWTVGLGDEAPTVRRGSPALKVELGLCAAMIR